jgi:hypothetical protein
MGVGKSKNQGIYFMIIRILDVASEDLIVGHRFYENLEPGLGAYFIDSLFSDIDSLQIYYGIHPLYFGKYHRMLSKRFPFAIYYRIAADVFVHAVLDCRSNPALTKVRLEEG